jgi:hypothetical protein
MSLRLWITLAALAFLSLGSQAKANCACLCVDGEQRYCGRADDDIAQRCTGKCVPTPRPESITVSIIRNMTRNDNCIPCIRAWWTEEQKKPKTLD